MAKTIGQTAGKLNADLGVASGVTSTTGIQSATFVGEKLAGDLQGIMKGGAKVVQEKQTANDKFALRSASESMTNLHKDIAALEANIQPDTDLRMVKEAEEQLYQFYGQKIFDNEDSQKVFDSQYHQPASKMIANKGVVLTQNANKQDHDKIVDDTESSYRLRVSQGEEIQKETLNGYVDTQTAGGYRTTDDAQLSFARESTLGFKDKTMNDMQSLLTASGWTPETGITKEIKNSIFNKTYSAFGKKNEDGSITWHDGIEDKARKEILASWKTFESAVSTSDSVDPFAELKKDTGSVVSNTKSSYISSVKIEENISTIEKQMTDISTKKPYTATQLNNMDMALDELKNQLTLTKTIETDVGNAKANVDVTRGYLDNGRDIKITKAGSGIEVTEHIKAEDYKRYLISQTNDLSESLFETDIDEKNSGQFNAQMVEVKRLEELNNGNKSAFTKTYEKLFAQDTLTNIDGRQSLKQAIAFHNFKAQTNKNWEDNAQLRKQLEGLLTKTINGKPLTDAQIKSWSETIITADKNTKQNASNNKTMVDETNSAIEDVADGTDTYGRLINARVPNTVSAAVAKDVVRNGKGRKTDDYIKDDMEWIDYGNTFFGTDTRIPNIKGVDKEVTKRAIDQVREAWNKEKATNLGKEEIDFDIKFDEGSNNYKIQIFKKDNNEYMGEITASNAEILANKKKSIFSSSAYQKARENQLKRNEDAKKLELKPDVLSSEYVSSKIDGMDKDTLDKLIKAESGGSYTELNSGSKAYGKYQFIPNTAYEYATRAGYKGVEPKNSKDLPDELKEFMTPEKQTEMFIDFSNRNTKGLSKAGIEATPLNRYIAHQQGLRGTTEILSAKNSELDIENVTNMVSNLGWTNEKEQEMIAIFNSADEEDKATIAGDIRDVWYDKYKEKFNKEA